MFYTIIADLSIVVWVVSFLPSTTWTKLTMLPQIKKVNEYEARWRNTDILQVASTCRKKKTNAHRAK